jgi:alcohol dehydrogenase (quinone), cytochrome c subunit
MSVRRRLLHCIAILCALLGAPSAHAADAAAPVAASDALERGAYLARAANCAGCHTARPEDRQSPPKPFAGGAPIVSPFGTIWSTNITPDKTHGIGAYSYEDFARALRDGIARDGRRLYPAMPYPSFSKISDEDMHALYGYFMQGVEPVADAAPVTHLPFPYDQRWALLFWNMAFAPNGRFQPNPARDAQWNRGAYLVQSLGHCGACHSPRGPAYNERGYDESSDTYLTGGTNGNWYASPLTGHMGAGLGRLTAQDIAALLKTGHGAGIVPIGSMVQVVEDSTQYLSEQDLLAIASYVKSLPATGHGGSFRADSNAAQQTMTSLRTGDVERPGAGLYESACARCHRSDGAGVVSKYPRLAGNPAVLAEKPDSLVRLVLEGGHAPSTSDGPPPKEMPAFRAKLTDTEIARVLTYVRTAWGNDALPVTTREVESMRHALASQH